MGWPVRRAALRRASRQPGARLRQLRPAADVAGCSRGLDMAVLLIFLALIASSAANAWTHPTSVLSDLSSFFSNLQDNLESMENMTPEERRMVLGGVDSPHEMLPQAGPGRPMSAPALMTSLRNQRPSSRTRHFVETSEPAALRRSNNHDPQVLWAGLGR